jgi:hypothetical protein
VRIKLVEVEAETGIKKRESAASSYYPEEWPEEFVSHSGQGRFVCGEAGLPLSGQIGVLVLDLLFPGKKDRLVGGPEVKAAFSVKALGQFIRLVHEEADRFCIFEQASHQL